MKLRIIEINIPSEYYFTAYLQPAFFSPNAVQCPGKYECFIFMFIQVFCCFLESFPARTCLCAVITDISLRQLHSEHCVCITNLRAPDFRFRHCYPINFLRNNFKSTCLFLVFRFMDILYFELLACKHAGLENDSHTFSSYETIFEIQLFRDVFIYKVKEVILLVHFNNSTDSTDTGRINSCTVQTIFLCCCKFFIGTHDTSSIRIGLIDTCLSRIEALFILKFDSIKSDSLILWK